MRRLVGSTKGIPQLRTRPTSSNLSNLRFRSYLAIKLAVEIKINPSFFDNQPNLDISLKMLSRNERGNELEGKELDSK